MSGAKQDVHAVCDVSRTNAVPVAVDVARKEVVVAVRLEPNQPDPYQALSRLYEQSGRLDLAIVALRDGINASASAAPTVRAELADRLAILYERAGMSREAEAEHYRAQTLRRQ